MSHKEKPRYEESIVRSWFNGGDEPDPDDEKGPGDDDAQRSPDNSGEDFSGDEGVDMGDEQIEPLPPVIQPVRQEDEN